MGIGPLTNINTIDEYCRRSVLLKRIRTLGAFPLTPRGLVSCLCKSTLEVFSGSLRVRTGVIVNEVDFSHLVFPKIPELGSYSWGHDCRKTLLVR